MQSTQIVIVGAGLSGLSAGKLLKEKGNNITVLEARDRVGGRTCTVHDPVHGKVDLGGAYVGPTQKNVYKLAEEFGLQFCNVYAKGKSVMNYKDNWTKFDSIPTSNPLILLDLNNVFRNLDTMATQVPLHAPWKAKQAKEWDSMSVKEYIDKTCWTQFAKDTVLLLVQTSCSAEPHEISLLSFLWSIRSGGGVASNMDPKEGAQVKFADGSQALSDKMAESLGDCVTLSCPVVSIQQTETKVHLTDKHGNRYTADYVILAIPPPLLSKITFDPPLCSAKAELSEKMDLGPVIKTFMYYEEAFWRKLDLSGIVASNYGPVPGTIDDTKPDGSHPAIMGIVVCNKARKLMQLSQTERKEELKKFYAEAFRNDQFLKPVGYLEKSWLEEEYSGGGYNTALPPGVLTSVGSCLRDTFGRIHFAGTETATMWSGHMDGAIQAGYRAGREIMQRMEGKPVTEVEEDAPMVLNRSLIETWLPSVTGLLQGTVGVSVVVILVSIAAYFVF